MDLNLALTRIEELEAELDALRQSGLSGEDRDYMEKLKADMRKAAAARENSESRASLLEAQLARQADEHRLHLAAQTAGCVDTQAFLAAAQAKGILEQIPQPEQMSGWLSKARTQMPYFFSTLRLNGDSGGASAPLFSVKTPRRAANTQQLAARAYRG
jgi:murein L,D-transpeptidase YcbB/YkuD